MHGVLSIKVEGNVRRDAEMSNRRVITSSCFV